MKIKTLINKLNKELAVNGNIDVYFTHYFEKSAWNGCISETSDINGVTIAKTSGKKTCEITNQKVNKICAK